MITKYDDFFSCGHTKDLSARFQRIALPTSSILMCCLLKKLEFDVTAVSELLLSKQPINILSTFLICFQPSQFLRFRTLSGKTQPQIRLERLKLTMDIRLFSKLNQLFIRGSLTQIKFLKIYISQWQNSVLLKWVFFAFPMLLALHWLLIEQFL